MSVVETAATSTQRVAASTGTTWAQVLVSELVADCREYSILRAVRRASRKARVLAMRKAYQQLTSMPAYHHYVATLSKRDRLFFLSERDYLARDLSARQRMEAALAHCRHESEAFDEEYLAKVYHGGGLVLWRAVEAEVEYDIRLVPGKDVSNEGLLSIVLNVDGTSVCICSYSTVPTAALLDGQSPGETETPLGDTMIYLTRKHLTRDYSYQAKFNKAFERTTPSHLCFGALTGIALAQGQGHVFAIDPDQHPSAQPMFNSSYGDFWTSLAGHKVSRFGFLIDVPIRLTPLKDLEPAKRKRALLRRAHIAAVHDSARAAISVHLRAR